MAKESSPPVRKLASPLRPPMSTSAPNSRWPSGAGPRAGQFLINGGKAIAAMDGRFSVAIEDIRKIAIPVLRHRISTNFQAQAEGMTNDDVINKLMADIPTPEIPKFEN